MLPMKLAGPYAHPSFQPVMLKVLPAEPMVTVRSHMSGSVAKAVDEIRNLISLNNIHS